MIDGVFLILDTAAVLAAGGLVKFFWTRREEPVFRAFVVLFLALGLAFLWLLLGDLGIRASNELAGLERRPIRPLVFRSLVVSALWYLLSHLYVLRRRNGRR